MPAFNAVSNGAALGDCVIDSIGLGAKFAGARGRLNEHGSRHRARRHRLRGRRAAAPDRRPSALHARGGDVGQPARRAGGQGLPAPGAAPIPTRRFNSQAEIAAAWCAALPQRRVFCAAPHGASAALIDALLDGRRAAPARKPRVVDISADFRYSHGRRPTRRSTSTRTARRSGSRSSPARCPSIWRSSPTPHVAHPGCFATAILLASVPLLAARPRRAARCSSAASPAAPARAASPSKARITRCATATCTPTARWRTATRRRSPRCAQAATGVDARVRLRAALGPVRARHPRHACRRALKRAARRARAASACCASSTPARRSCACIDAGAARQGRRRQQLRAPLGRGQWATPSR